MVSRNRNRMTPARLTRAPARLRVAMVVSAAVLGLTGCTGAMVGSPTETAADAKASGASPISKSVVLAALGAVPPAVPRTDEQVEEQRISNADFAWGFVVDKFPDETRPEVDFVRYVQPEESAQARHGCLVERGVTGASIDIDGNLSIDMSDPDTVRDSTIGSYACSVAYPASPGPQLSDEQSAYLYDYFVKFLVPCLEAEGQEISDAPSREAFIANWPNQGWFPVPDDDRTEAVCQNVPDGLE